MIGFGDGGSSSGRIAGATGRSGGSFAMESIPSGNPSSRMSGESSLSAAPPYLLTTTTVSLASANGEELLAIREDGERTTGTAHWDDEEDEVDCAASEISWEPCWHEVLVRISIHPLTKR